MQGFVRRSDLPRGQEQPDQPGGDNGPTGGATPEPGNSEADGPDETLFQWGIRTLRAELQTRGCEKGIPNRDQTLKTDHVAETPRSRPKRSTRRNLWRSAARILAITMTMLNVTTAYKNEHFGDYDNRAKGEADNTTDRGVRFKSTEVVYHLDNNFERREEDIEAEKLAKDERRTVNECIKWVLSSSWARDELGKEPEVEDRGYLPSVWVLCAWRYPGLAQNSTTAPGLTRLLNRILRDRFPESKYAAMSLNIGCETPLHRDSHNVATCPNYVVLLEKPRWGGGLWVELGENDVMQGPVIPKTCPRGNSLFGQVRDLEKGTSCPPRRWHQSEPWDGQRVTLVGYTPLGYLRAPEGIVHRLRQLGFPLPDRRQIQHLRGSVRGEQERTLVKRSEKAKTSEGVYAVTDQGGSTKPGGAELSGNGIQFQKGVKPEVASALRRLHQNMAHPSNTELIRHLRIAGAEQKIIDAVKGMTCQSCARTRKPQNRRPAATANLLSFNEVVAIDIVSVYDIHNKRHDLLSILDVGSSYHTMVPLVDMKGPAVAEKFAERWINVFGAPECVAMDTDSIFQGALGELTSWYNMRTRPTAGQAHWQAGIIEKQGDLWKELWRRVVEEKSVESSDVPVAVAAVNSAKNELRRVSGFSPSQIVFGRNPKLPEDLIDNGDNLGANYLLTTDLKRQREVAIRTAARLSFHKLQVDDKLRRALLHQTRTRSRPVEVGESVFFFREDRNYKKGSTANHKLGRWRGPGVVIGFEGQNTWVSQAGRCFLVAPEHIRAPTGEELGEIFRLEATRSELDRLLARDLDDPTVYEEDMNPDRGEIGVVDGEMDFKSGDHGLATGWRERAQPRGEPGYEPIRRQRHKGPGPHDRDSSGTKDAYMMKRAKTSRSREKQMEKEIAWKDIPPELHEDFRAAERKQWNEHISNNAFEVLDADASEYYRKTIDPEYILDSRFAYRDKNYGRRKASPQENIPWKPKARLVIAGHRDPALAQGKTVSDAPTVSRASLIAVLQIAASHAWEIAAGDVEAAFLNGVELDRFLLMRQPRGGIDGLRPSQLLRVRKGVFGLAESPRRWFDKMNGDITREGLRLDSGDMAYFKPSPLDACVFMLQVNGEGPPLAYLTTHVDDILVAAPKNLNGLIRNELSRRFPISDWELDEFDYVGSHIRNDLEGIHITQAGYVDGRLFRVDVQKEQKDDDEANEEQRIDNMSAVGALSWLAAQTRPDLQCGVSMAQQVQGRPLVRDLKFTNSLVKRAESHRTCGIWLRPIPLGESIVVVFHDAAWANVPQDPEDEIYRLTSQEDELGLQHEGPYAEDRLRKAKRKNSQVASQIGHLVCLFHADALKGETCRPSVLEWRSQACQRVCRSTFAAETIACVEALEGGQFTRSLLASLRQGRLVKVEEAREGHRLLCLSDCRSLYDHLVKIGACRLPSNRRLAIDIAALKQDLALETRGKRLPLRWVPTTAQMGDPLTKPMRVEMWWRQLNDGYLFPFFEEDENNGEPV